MGSDHCITVSIIIFSFGIELISVSQVVDYYRKAASVAVSLLCMFAKGSSYHCAHFLE